MPSVEFQEANVTCTAEDGEQLRKVALKNKVSVYGGPNKLLNCRGFGLCGMDRVKVDPKDCLTPMTWKEKLHLEEKSGVRLACQAHIKADAKVSVAPALEYGQQMAADLPVFAVMAFFSVVTLGFVVFMAFELVGKPLL